jgi:uncharacterized membrane protein YhhN
MRPRERVLAEVGVLAAAVFLLGLAFDSPLSRLIAKPIPALCLAAWVAGRPRSKSARWFAVGLVLSAAGDVLLEYSPGLFVAGLVAFLGAHLAYITGFLIDTRRPALARAAPFAVWAVLGYLAMRDGLGSLGGPVVVYLTAVCVMMWRAAAGVGRDGAPQAHEWMALGGAVLFGASDTLIGLDRFHAPLAGARVPIIILYWVGQLGIAAGVAFSVSRETAPPATISGNQEP